MGTAVPGKAVPKEVVGIREQETRLIDGRLYDVKEYELLADLCFMRKV
jgi:hypothetical protein